MGATDRLRQLLNEREVNWTVPDESYNQDSVTYWQVGNIEWVAFAMGNDTLLINCNSVTNLTPEQAIATTLGRGTSKAVSMRERDGRPYLKDELVCAKCGCQLAHEFGHVWQNFCPNCGAELVK